MQSSKRWRGRNHKQGTELAWWTSEEIKPIWTRQRRGTRAVGNNAGISFRHARLKPLQKDLDNALWNRVQI